jgi:hypothetical protein
MTRVMSPSEKPITKGQIGKWSDVLADALVKSGLPSGPIQQIFQTKGVALAEEFVLSVRKRVEMITNIIIRHVRIDRARSPHQVLEATSRRLYVNDDIVDRMPRGDKDEDDIHFFKPGPSAYKNGSISDADLKQEFDQRGLKPADPYKLTQANADDPTFADSYPNGTHWNDADGKWCFAVFSGWCGERRVCVNRNDDDWDDCWWFAGVPK